MPAPPSAPISPPYDGLLLASLATLDGDGYGAIEDGALAWRDGRITFVGPRATLPAPPVR